MQLHTWQYPCALPAPPPNIQLISPGRIRQTPRSMMPSTDAGNACRCNSSSTTTTPTHGQGQNSPLHAWLIMDFLLKNEWHSSSCMELYC